MDAGSLNGLLMWFAIGMLGYQQANRDGRPALAAAWFVLALFALCAAVVFGVSALVERST